MRSLSVGIGEFGALVSVEVGLSLPRKKALQRNGLAIPPEQQVVLVIDTGASHSVIDASVMRSLQLQPINSYRYHSTSTKGVPEWCDAYDVELSLGSVAESNLWRIGPLEVMANSFIGHHYQGLLGRDVLDRTHMAWRGPTRQVFIEYP